ncbi:hypothetical protein L226DRAFT_315446 [Lentinus tigrinus ALCF2SS1-7]|uniref:Uncharacterized protein n=1 Tax=Lentinus tigrinus ALCF2SS1-6 TaxID=1328759 RepID=A0A5C2S6L9_9APHY|nr:hypothetical protein L227DRAFT_158583 [Lentinus tigrinus ALCF2SS1-6]RPD68763.1 hypothetical protein L226DRAFT_315446 [Lentinus tigrinus ALCF2SS1-7]
MAPVGPSRSHWPTAGTRTLAASISSLLVSLSFHGICGTIVCSVSAQAKVPGRTGEHAHAQDKIGMTREVPCQPPSPSHVLAVSTTEDSPSSVVGSSHALGPPTSSSPTFASSDTTKRAHERSRPREPLYLASAECRGPRPCRTRPSSQCSARRASSCPQGSRRNGCAYARRCTSRGEPSTSLIGSARRCAHHVLRHVLQPRTHPPTPSLLMYFAHDVLSACIVDQNEPGTNL